MGDFPLMTENGTFVINGAERVVVSQLVRSPGVYFTAERRPGHRPPAVLRQADPEPRRLARVRDLQQGLLSVKVDRKRKIPVTILLRAIGYGTPNDEDRWRSSPTSTPTRDHHYISGDDRARTAPSTRKRRSSSSTSACAPATRPRSTTPRQLLNSLLFNPRRYDLAGRPLQAEQAAGQSPSRWASTAPSA